MNLVRKPLHLTLFYTFLCLMTLTLFTSKYLYSKDLPLQVLALSKGEGPVFNLAYEVPYDSSLLENLPESQEAPLYITLDASSIVRDLENRLSELVHLSEGYKTVMLSLLQDETLSDSDYTYFCSELHLALKSQGVSNIYLIAYPRNLKNPLLFKSDALYGIGVGIEQVEDLKKLDALSGAAKVAKPLFVQDGIKSFYGQDITRGIKALYESYYTFAVKYPSIDTILIPSSATSHPQYARAYETVMNHIQGTYTGADLAGGKLSGEKHLILWGSRDFFKDTAYVEYKWNDSSATQSVHYPYPLTVDTDILHDGINRLRVIGFDSKNQVLWRKTWELQVYNNQVPSRSKRGGTSYAITSKPSYRGSYIPVLMYHSFSEKVPSGSSSSYVSTALFDQQLEALLKNHYTPITFYDLKLYLAGLGGLPEKPVILTADDGYLNNYTHAFPLLKKHKVPATFFVSTAFVGIDESNDNTVHPHFSWEEALEMERSGLVDIQIHGYDHTRFTKLSMEELAYQISISLGLIEKHLGKRDVVVAAYPQFKSNASTKRLLADMGVNLQITDLAKRGTVLKADGIKRINVPNTMSAEELISTIEGLTQ